MALWPMRSFDRDMDPMRDFDRFERRMMRDMDRFQSRMMPYWRDEDQSILHIANQAHEVVNDGKKFAVSLDVSKFKPEELQVIIDGRNLTIEGKQEEKTEHGHMERSFVRSWTLPEEVDLDAVHRS
ncbi:Hsp20/alpha crystallin family protein [Necator americanus]|uniref:Hsp20/alpha crystallin family protein n=1 Tax=Necator americanus TaxID=51031 RepID=W2TLT2_NECAM|nr:Hsp20/alpha crystallin family protein [Necator americanus]ETN82096.1 Hsp20/alpha crystallin family protein [Necator americanus]